MIFSSVQGANYLRTNNASKLSEVLFFPKYTSWFTEYTIGDTPIVNPGGLSLNLHMLQKSFFAKLLFKIYYSNRKEEVIFPLKKTWCILCCWNEKPGTVITSLLPHARICSKIWEVPEFI